jgi:purine-binding chemotaxis protein CheW
MSTLHVAFKVSGSEYVVPAADVLHMESFQGATRVPGSPEYVRGIVQVRGRVVPVIDLRVRFGDQAAELSPDARIIVVQADGRAVGLLADSAREVLRLDPTQFRAAPEVVIDGGQGFVKSVTQAGARIVMLLDLKKVLGEENVHGE